MSIEGGNVDVRAPSGFIFVPDPVRRGFTQRAGGGSGGGACC
jgi:hypothetical protein